jgi:dihydropteroate synthase
MQQRWRLCPYPLLRGELDLSQGPRIVGILNVTPDSFADGGLHVELSAALEAAHRMVAEGADALDVGGVSTRPGASAVDGAEQIRRVVPVIAGIRAAAGALRDVPIMVDTTLVEVARAALDAGADAVNDQSAGRDDEGMFALCAERGAGIVLMHRVARPSVDSYSDQYIPSARPRYDDVVTQVRDFLSQRASLAREAGIAPEAIVIDPGLGFGKTVEQSMELVTGTSQLAALAYPVLSALSRKSFVGRISLGRDSRPDERLAGTLACSIMHMFSGARLFRVHDVGAHRQALRAAWALRERHMGPVH